MKTYPRTRTLAFLSLAISAGLLGACSSTPAPTAGTPLKFYPAAAPHDTILDVQVFKGPTYIEFTNTTSRAFGQCTLWLNGRYQREVDAIRVGQTVQFNLKDFRDEFGEPFGSGGFWAADDPEKLVLTQIEVQDDAGKTHLLGLVTVRADE